MDIRGVIPEPADRKRYRWAGCRADENSPAGPNTRNASPTSRRSCSQFDTLPPGTRLTVMDKVCGRVGGDEIV
ncbi:hypothetical protein D3C71_1808600 [compost metagenome]